MEYPGNTDKSKEEKTPKQIEKVVTGEVIQKPKGIGRKFKDIFFGGDLRTATRYIAGDVLLPALRNLFVDMVSKGAERVVYGEGGYRRRGPSDYRPRVSYTSYNNPIYRGDPRASRPLLPDQSSRNRQRKDSDNLILASKEEAEKVVEQLIDIIDKYEVVSWADLCELVGWPSSPVDNKWGWNYLTNVDIRQTRDGYLIDLPPMEEI